MMDNIPSLQIMTSLGGILDKIHLSMYGIDSGTFLVTTEVTNYGVIGRKARH